MGQKNKKYIQIISQQTLFAEKLTFPISKIDQLKNQMTKGFLGGGFFAAIVFIGSSFTTSVSLFSFTAIVFAPVWIPAVITFFVGGATISVIIHYLVKLGIFKGNKKEIIRSFNSKLDELAIFVFTLVLQPSIAILSTCTDIDESRKRCKIKELLLDWGYSPEWIDSELENMEKFNFSLVEKITSKLWNEYRCHVKRLKSGNRSKNSDRIIIDLPNPDDLRDKMVECARNLLDGERTGDAQNKYLSILTKF